MRPVVVAMTRFPFAKRKSPNGGTDGWNPPPSSKRLRLWRVLRYHTGQGGPCPPTGKSTTTDYVYVMDFDGDKIRHMTKIWNAGWAMKELGWA